VGSLEQGGEVVDVARTDVGAGSDQGLNGLQVTDVGCGHQGSPFSSNQFGLAPDASKSWDAGGVAGLGGGHPFCGHEYAPGKNTRLFQSTIGRVQAAAWQL